MKLRFDNRKKVPYRDNVEFGPVATALLNDLRRRGGLGLMLLRIQHVEWVSEKLLAIWSIPVSSVCISPTNR